MKISMYKYMPIMVAAFAACSSAVADWTWTGNSTEPIKYWSDGGNWSGTDGKWYINSPATINFNEKATGIGASIRIGGSTAESPVVFTTGDRDDESCGLEMGEGAENAYLSSSNGAGYLVVNGGYYLFGNDLIVGGRSKNDGTLVLNYGKVETRYWMYLCGDDGNCTGNLTVAGGELKVGGGNGRLVVGQAGGSTATVTQTGGSVVSGQSECALEMACNGNTSYYNISGGTYTANSGRVWIGNGTKSKAYLNISDDAVVTVKDGTLVGTGTGAEGVITVTGGEFKPNWLVLGGKKGVSGAAGRMLVDGGKVTMGETLYVTENDGGANSNTGVLEVVSGTVTLKTSYFGRSNNSLAKLDISGGDVTADAKMVIGCASGAEAVATVSGGTLTVANIWADVILGDNGNGSLTIKDNGVVSCGSETVGTWLVLGSAGSGTRAVNLEEGGTLKVWHVERSTSSGTSEFNFDGGTLVALNKDGNNSRYLLGNTDPAHTVNPTVNVKSKGGAIDTNGKDVITITADMSGEGTITKKGSGALTLSGGYFAGIAVDADAGAVTTPGGGTVNAGESFYLVSKIARSTTAGALAGKNLWLEAGGKIVLSGVTLDFSDAIEQKLFEVDGLKLLNETVAADTDVSEYFTIEGAAVSYKVLYKHGEKSFYAAADLTENKWIGPAEGEWSNSENWSDGVPTERSLVVFESDAVVTRSGTGTKKCWLKLVIRNAAIVELKNTDDATLPGYELSTGCIEGEGTLVLTHCGMTAKSDTLIPETIKLLIQNGTHTTADGYDCWLHAADGVSLTVNGEVEVKDFLMTADVITFNGAVTLDDGARVAISNGTATFNAALECKGAATIEKFSAATVLKGESATFTQPTGLSHVNRDIATLFGVDTSVTAWIGPAEGGDWTLARNWSYGTPVAGQGIKFTSDTVVAIKENNISYGKLVLDTPSVTFTRGSGGEKFHVTAIEGSGTLTLDNLGIAQVNGQTLEIANDMVMKNGSWFGDWNYGGVVNMRGNLTVDGEMQIWMKAEFFGNISGQGSIVLKQAGACPAFHGDNRGFHGTIEKNFKNGLTIDGVNAAGDDIAWRIGGDVTLNVKTGIVMFGSLDLWKNDWCVMYLPDGADTILEVGGNDNDFVFGDGYFLWGNGSDKTNIAPTIRKVGAGTLTSYLYNFKYLDVQEGKVVLNSPSTMDGASNKAIASVAVASGAAIGGNAGSVADRLTIANLSLAKGAIVSQPVESSGEGYSCPTLTASGAVDVAGVKFTLSGDTSATTAENSSFTPLAAASVSGSPVPDGLVPSSVEGMIWFPRLKATVGETKNAVAMLLRKHAPGLIFVIR